MDQTHPHEPETSAARERVPIRQVGRWLAPWLIGALLILAAILGLHTASAARGDAAYAIGFITAALAVILLALLLRAALRAGPAASMSLLVDGATALVILVALLSGLAIAGLVLAARTDETLTETVGYALFGFSLLFIFWNLKHYFDRRDSRGRR